MESDDILRLVLQRKKKEELAAVESKKAHKESDLSNLERENFYLSLGPETGAGCWFAEKNEDQLVCNINNDNWYAYDKSKQRWVEDLPGQSLKEVESIAVRCVEKAVALSTKIKEAVKKGEGESEEIEKLKEKRKAWNAFANKIRTDRGRRNVLKFAQTNKYKSLQVSGDRFDQDPLILGCTNCVIDLRTGEGRAGRPDDYITKGCSVDFPGIEAPAPDIWLDFLWSVFEDNEIIAFIQRLLGYCSTGLVKEAIFILLYGMGRNGKSVLMELLLYIFDTLATPIPADMLLDQGKFSSSSGPSPDVMLLHGSRFAIGSEPDENKRISSPRVKLYSGRDTVIARHLHDKRMTRFIPTHKLILMSNSMPDAPMSDLAFWERILLIPFNFSFVDREPKAPNERRADKHLLDKLKVEAPGILAWVIRGCLEYQKTGLCPPEKVRAATEAYRRSEDLLADFIEECCFTDVAAEEQASALYDSFKEWWASNVSKKPLSQKKFGRLLAVRFERIKSSTVKYKGLRLLKS